MKKYIAFILSLLIVSIPLTACQSGGEDNDSLVVSSKTVSEANSSSLISTSSNDPTEEFKRIYLEGKTATVKLVDDFCKALVASDIDYFNGVGHYNFDTSKKDYYDFMKDVKITEATATFIEPEIGYSDTYDYKIKFYVSNKGTTAFNNGWNEYIISYFEGYQGNYPFWGSEKQLNNKITSVLNDDINNIFLFIKYLTYGKTFNDPLQIDKNKLHTCISEKAGYDQSIATGENFPANLTQEQINAVAKKYFGLDEFVYTDNPDFYDTNKKLYITLGIEGTKATNDKLIDATKSDDKINLVYEQYDDSLHFKIYQTIEYTLKKSGDSYIIQSAKVVDNYNK